MTTQQPKRRVALFRNNFLPYSETFIHDELRFHVRYEVTVMARTLRNEERFKGHKIVAVDHLAGPRDRLGSAWYGATGRSPIIDTAIQTGHFDILHAHFGHNGVYALGFARRHRLPLVVSLHGRDVTVLIGKDRFRPNWWYYSCRCKALFREATYFLAASTELKELIVRAGCPAEKVLINRLGVDLDNFHPQPDQRATSPVELVMVGRFVEKKGHMDGIAAVAQAVSQGHDVKLVLIGDGPLKPQYDRQIAALGLTPRDEFTGPLPHGGVLERISRSTVVLAPSVIAKNLDRESGLIVAKEAAACGIPTIGTLHGGIPDIIDNGVTGFLVPEHDPQRLGERLCQLLGDEELRASFGLAARAKMEREYDIRHRIAALEVIYDDAIQAYKGR